MALNPLNESHALQIQAGILGRHEGHSFEDRIAQSINGFTYPLQTAAAGKTHVYKGNPGNMLLQFLAADIGAKRIAKASAISTGALATSETGRQWLSINGATVSRCKSDLVITLTIDGGRDVTVGVSVKQCNNRNPTNAQLYFTTAGGFAKLLRSNGMRVSEAAITALRQFCGDEGFRPRDNPPVLKDRATDPRRFFWEEIDPRGRLEWEKTLADHHDKISQLLLQKAYSDDPFVPEYLIHKTKKAISWNDSEVAIYSIDELVVLSRKYQGFAVRPYSVRKGSHKDPPGVSHLAPRFGVIQMQRGGQAQHPAQLQFNLGAGYFYKLE